MLMRLGGLGGGKKKCLEKIFFYWQRRAIGQHNSSGKGTNKNPTTICNAGARHGPWTTFPMNLY